MDYTGGYGTMYKAWRKEVGITFDEISDNDEENYERMTMQAASGATECESKGEHDGKIFDMTLDTSLASPAAPNTIVSIKSVLKIGSFKNKRMCLNHILWRKKFKEISDNDEENCERMTMQAASGATECESKGEHDGKIFDMTVDTLLASPAAPNKIVSIKSIAKIDTCKKNGMVSQMILQAASHTSSMSMMSTPAYDGLQLEDQIEKFRDVEYGDNLLPNLASKAQKNQGRLVLMLVMKQGTSINLVVKPRTWRHRGMLGYVPSISRVVCFSNRY
nr:26S proteasome non-ATPase regulatory subunit 9 [Tanacetum cinerariifolium]